MATTRPAKAEDTKGIAALFNSDPNYYCPWFNTPERIRGLDNWLDREGLNIARLVAVDETEIVGYICAERSQLENPSGSDGRVAVVKRVLVKPNKREMGISSQLLDKVEAEITAAGYDFAMASAVCGHPNSQNLFIGKGYMATGFAPNSINTSLTLASQRESLLYVVKAISEKARLGSRRRVYVPPEAVDVLAAAYSAAGLSGLRDVVVDCKTKAGDEEQKLIESRLRSQIRENPAEYSLPQSTIDITKPEHVSMLKAYMDAGYVPVGVLPIGTDRAIMMYVPKGLVFDLSRVKMADGASSLAKIVGDAYNSKALAPQGGTR